MYLANPSKPNNLFGLMANDSLGHNMYYLKQNENFAYSEYLSRFHSIYPDIGDHENKTPVVSDEQVRDCLLEMIKVDGAHARMDVWLFLLLEDNQALNRFLSLYFVQEDGQWLLDDMRINENH